MISLRRFSVLWVVVLTVGCAGGAQERTDLEAETQSGSRPGSIAFIGRGGGIWVHDLATGRSSRISGRESGPFAHPTWAPTGDRVAFVDGAGNLYVGGDGEPISMSSRSNPFYLYWNPTGELIGYLGPARSGRGLDLRVADPDAGTSFLVGTGEPYYWVWNPEGGGMLTHTGGSALNNPRLARISLLDGEALEGEPLPLAPGFFQSPEVSPDGSRFVVVAREPGADRTLVATAVARGVSLSQDVNQSPTEKLFLLSRTGVVQRELAVVEGIASFDWSPTQEELAYVDGVSTPFGGIIGPLRLINTVSGTVRDSRVGPVLAYFWAPDGTRLVAFRPQLTAADPPTLQFEVLLVDSLTMESGRIAVFEPTTHFLRTIIPFYDQYQRSATIWSPDSSKIVVNAITPEGPSILVIDVRGKHEPRLIDQGFHPVWSPR